MTSSRQRRRSASRLSHELAPARSLTIVLLVLLGGAVGTCLAQLVIFAPTETETR